MVPIHAMTESADARRLDEKADAHQHVNAGGHHRRGVDQRGDRRRTFHGVRQPDVQRELRGFSDGAAKDQERRDREILRITGNAADLLGHVLKNNGAGRGPDHQDPEHESEIADAIGQERFLGGLGRGSRARTNGRSANRN